MSKLIADLCRLLQVNHLKTSVYHPQTDSLIEQFNQMLKRMLRRVMDEDVQNWDLLLSHVLFAVLETPQASTGFNPYEFLFAQQPKGLPGNSQRSLEGVALTLPLPCGLCARDASLDGESSPYCPEAHAGGPKGAAAGL